MDVTKPVKLAILWHMHQPNYQDSGNGNFVLPWVRLHALKDYLDMALLASSYENVKVTFNLVPALIDQLDAYIKGATDPHLDLSRKDVLTLNESEKRIIIDSFFSAPVSTMIEPYSRYHELYLKKQNNFNQKVLPSLFSSEEIRDLQIWSNLVWIDPMFREETPIKELFDKGRHFSESDKQALFEWQNEFIGRIIPTYKKLLDEDKIDISFTPYYHPILPLLCDSNAAKEALPDIKLPENRFNYPEDANRQIAKSVTKFEELFEKKLSGMWPSEGSVSEEAVKLIADNDVKWIATDEEVLYNSLKKSSMMGQDFYKYRIYSYNGVKIFFRDHALSDLVGFVYSQMDPLAAADDFIKRVRQIREDYKDRLDDIVIPVILDGENAWEYFKNDGIDFLQLLYEKISDDDLIESISLSDASEKLPSIDLPSLFAGSWINHNFKIWIGHSEDNKAWDLLYNARKTLTEFVENNRDFNSEAIDAAWEKIYIAEGSDWCWWYGDEHRGPGNKMFDEIYRKHLSAVYLLIGLDIPDELNQPIYQPQLDSKLSMPEQLISPIIDGRVSHFYEWTGSGSLENILTGGAMHRVDRLIEGFKFAYDHMSLYIRLDLNIKKILDSYKKPIIRILFKEEKLNISCPLKQNAMVEEEHYRFALDEIFEIGINRNYLFEEQSGEIGLSVAIMDDTSLVERCPEVNWLDIEIPPRDNEMFWPS